MIRLQKLIVKLPVFIKEIFKQHDDILDNAFMSCFSPVTEEQAEEIRKMLEDIE